MARVAPRTLNRSYHDPVRARRQRRVFGVLVLIIGVIILVLVGLGYLVYGSSVFAIKQIDIANSSNAEKLAVRKVADDYLAQKHYYLPYFKNIFLVDVDQLSDTLAMAFPQARNINVAKHYLNGLSISLEKREALGIWCYTQTNQCVYFSNDRLAFAEAAVSSGSLLLAINDQIDQPVALGQSVTTPEMLAFILKLQLTLNRQAIGFNKIIIPADELFRVNVVTSEGWQIYLNTNEDVIAQMSSLEIFMTQKLTADQRAKLVYLDVRIPDRVYYK